MTFAIGVGIIKAVLRVYPGRGVFCVILSVRVRIFPLDELYLDSQIA